ncbi:conserved hypothetical protein [Thermosulfidibacter takaii ABI70S6]|uniref:Acyclic terpene utilisation N-terminal domain-containing protein n=1 Tax=Thermosulfidibacter takaii (strain DSM 17441 / JCM 13301 / NBRC 103674 / ABI70S6) TaxID=1298851 RepID=A0A0S3QSN6_THET7|nr:acyclic terpene utilization AtuA family protein [Thermosulfidibacter takaii]BAT71308.1 conserved hypothetical protein [Thermosulfidibacter takaii ABI70S6]
MKESLIIFAPQGMLGYGYPMESFKRALSLSPNMIGVDAGSTDAGPYRLGSGKPTTSEEAVKKDLAPMMEASLSLKIPLIIGSAGGAGAKPHVDWTLSIIEKIAKEIGKRIKLAVVYSDISKKWLIKKLQRGQTKPLGPVPELKEKDVEEANNMVGVMGIEPYIGVLEKGADIVLAGRSNDPAIFASFAILKGIPEAIAFHSGKILECGAIASVPGTASDGMIAFLSKDHFIVEPANPERKCTPLSVASHSLYEKEHPYMIPGPEGTLYIKNASFSAVDERRVKVEGSRFIKAPEKWIKLEGAKESGYRSIFIAFIEDPIMIEAKEEWIHATKEAAFDYFGQDIKLIFHLKGNFPTTLIVEAIADTQQKAQAVCSWTRSYLMHYHYKGRKATSGNLALPFSPSDIPMGKAYEFNIHHLVKLEEKDTIFNMETVLL